MEETMRERKVGVIDATAKRGQREDNRDWASIMEDGYKQGDTQPCERDGPMVQENRERTHGHKTEAEEIHASAQELRDILELQDYRCAACHVDLTPDMAEIDHITPRSDGGDNSPRNLQWLCRHCNRAKGGMSMAAFIAMVERIAASRA